MSIQRFVLLGMLAAGTTGLLEAQPPQGNSVTRQSTFAPVGVAGTETIQVNLANTAANAANGTAAACNGSVTFLDSTGKAITGSGGTFAVAAGQTVSMSLPGSKIPASSTTGTRPEVRVSVSLITTVPHPAPCALAQSAETFDSTTGATHSLQSSTVPLVSLPLGLAIGGGDN